MKVFEGRRQLSMVQKHKSAILTAENEIPNELLYHLKRACHIGFFTLKKGS